MYGDAMTMARVEHAERGRAYRRAMGDPEQAWLIDAARAPAEIAIDLGRVRRSLQAVLLAVVGRF